MTLAVTTGTIDITVPTGPVSLGTVAASSSPQTVSAQLGNVTVTDNRGGTTGWVVTANGVDFTGPQSISVSAPGSSSYSTPAATVTGTATVNASNLNPLYPPGPVQTATGVSGINTAVWNPTISVTIPADALAGTYSSTEAARHPPALPRGPCPHRAVGNADRQLLSGIRPECRLVVYASGRPWGKAAEPEGSGETRIWPSPQPGTRRGCPPDGAGRDVPDLRPRRCRRPSW